jgi:hypothetical protein
MEVRVAGQQLDLLCSQLDQVPQDKDLQAAL